MTTKAELDRMIAEMPRGRQKASREPKYKNHKCEHGGVKFDSKRELARWLKLKVMERAGTISDLQRQQPFILAESVTLDGRKRPAIKYIADFTYQDGFGYVVEDAKGFKTPEYKIKRHLMKLVHGIEVREV